MMCVSECMVLRADTVVATERMRARPHTVQYTYMLRNSPVPVQQNLPLCRTVAVRQRSHGRILEFGAFKNYSLEEFFQTCLSHRYDETELWQ